MLNILKKYYLFSFLLLSCGETTKNLRSVKTSELKEDLEVLLSLSKTIDNKRDLKLNTA